MSALAAAGGARALAGAIIGGAFGLLGDHLAGRRAKAQAKTEAEVALIHARVERERLALQGELSWDERMAAASERSWKDEAWTLVFIAPFVVAFLPGGAEILERAFAALETVPAYYQAFIALAVAAAFGYRGLVRPFLEGRFSFQSRPSRAFAAPNPAPVAREMLPPPPAGAPQPATPPADAWSPRD